MPGALGTVGFRGAALDFHPTLRLSEEYSDNFFQTTRRSQENFRTTFGPGFTLALNGAHTFGSLSTTVDLIHDTVAGSGDDIKVFPSMTASVRYSFTPNLSLTLRDTFIRNDQASTVDQFGIRQGRQTFNTNTFVASVDWLLDRVATQTYYQNVLFINEGNNNQQSGSVGGRGNNNDSITHVLGLNATTRIATEYLVRAGYEFSLIDNTGGGTNGGTNGGTTADTTTHTGFGSVSRQIGSFVNAGLSGSYSYQTLENTTILNTSLFGAYGLPTGLSLGAAVGYSILNSDTRDNEGTVTANGTASYQFASAVVSLGVFQDFRQTGQQGQNFGTVESRSYFGSFLYQFTPFINAVAQATYSENEPTGTGNVNTNQGDQKQTTLTYGASLNWLVLRWLTASLRYTYTKQTGANVFNQSPAGGSGDYAENRASLNLFAAF